MGIIASGIHTTCSYTTVIAAKPLQYLDMRLIGVVPSLEDSSHIRLLVSSDRSN